MKHFKWLVIVSLTFFLVLTGHWPGNDHHFSWNLEPYPDGLFYVVPAWNLIEKGSFVFSYQDLVTIKPSILPLYSLILASGYLLFHQPAAFYWVNIGLGVISIVALLYTFKSLKLPLLAQLLGIGAYLLHGLIFWLPTVPMAENLGLTLMSLSVLGITKLRQKLDKKWIVLTTFACVALVFTKYTFALPAGVLMAFAVWQLWRQKAWRMFFSVVGIGSLGVLIYALYQLSIGFNPFNVILNLGVESKVVAKTTFYSLEHLPQNLPLYLKMLSGSKTHFLWLTTVFTHGLLVLGAGLGFWLSMKEKATKTWSVTLLAAFWAQLPVLLIFYVVDARYLILSLPLIAVGIGLLVGKPPKYHWFINGLVMGTLIVFAVQQLPLWRSLIASNWLNRSEAWQYRAVQVLDEVVLPNSYVITVLPPHLVELYSQKTYQVLPLSQQQEFLEKKQVVWPALTQPTNLREDYQRKLETGSLLYASRAYLSAESDFTQAWQELDDNFELTLVAEGCANTCNVYQVTLPVSE